MQSKLAAWILGELTDEAEERGRDLNEAREAVARRINQREAAGHWRAAEAEEARQELTRQCTFPEPEA